MNQTTVQKKEQLFGKIDTLRYFFEEPEREFHLREFARLIRHSPSTTAKYLSELLKNGVLITRKNKGLLLYKSNTENRLYKDTKLFYNLQIIRSSGLIDYLIEEFNHPKVIILFGSFRKSENIPESDMDIFVETAIKRELDLSQFEKKLKHPIQLFQFSSKELEEMKSKNKELLNNILNGII